jgi:hypothetical protein
VNQFSTDPAIILLLGTIHLDCVLLVAEGRNTSNLHFVSFLDRHDERALDNLNLDVITSHLGLDYSDKFFVGMLTILSNLNADIHI